MDPRGTPNPTETRLRDALRQDIKRPDLWSSVKRDFADVREFYIDSEKKSRLDDMGWLKGTIYLLWWMLKSMILKLTPARRLLLLMGALFVLAGQTVHVNDSSTVTYNWHMLGGIILVFVLMLELKDKLLARDELEAGRKVQKALTPEPSPSIPGWSLWLYTRPANDVGGDLVDHLRIGPERHGLVLGDVAGKGLKAALLMAKLQATLRALAPDYPAISALASKVNEIFHRDSLPNVFASMLYGELDTSAYRIRFVNAGHLPPIILNSSGIKEMAKGEPALGLMDVARYTEQTVEMQTGDVFVAYSDGLTEARNLQGEFYGTERFFRLLKTLARRSAQQIGQAIAADVEQFVGEARPHDDISMIIVERDER
jgi:hypothetical protein